MEHPDATFLARIADRLVSVYGESANADFVLRLGQIAASAQRTNIQFGEAMALINRVYLKLTGCSLPEFDTMLEISDTIIEAINELDPRKSPRIDPYGEFEPPEGMGR